MAKSARRMRRSARRMHRGGGAHLAPAPVDGMAAGPAGDAMTAQGPAAEAALVGDNQMPAADWKKKSMEELGFGAGDAGQAGGKKHSRKHHKRGGKKHSRKTHKRGGKKHSRKHHKRGGKKHSRKHHGKRH